jgi:hypothetical protein
MAFGQQARKQQDFYGLHPQKSARMRSLWDFQWPLLLCRKQQ